MHVSQSLSHSTLTDSGEYRNVLGDSGAVPGGLGRHLGLTQELSMKRSLLKQQRADDRRRASSEREWNVTVHAHVHRRAYPLVGRVRSRVH
jgi:hypothetical protein